MYVGNGQRFYLFEQPAHTCAPAPASVLGQAGRRRCVVCGHNFLPNARENSKFLKGTPFISIFSYLNFSTFHTISNMRLKSFCFSSPFSYWIRQLLIWISHSFRNEIEHLNISRSSSIGREHTPIIIRMILATDHTWIQLKDSLEVPRFSIFVSVWFIRF